MAVPASPCQSCPFEGEDPIQLSADRWTSIYQKVAGFQGSHLCHTADNQKLCRGGRNLQIKIAFLTGMIAEQTDAAFQASLLKAQDRQSAGGG